MLSSPAASRRLAAAAGQRSVQCALVAARPRLPTCCAGIVRPRQYPSQCDHRVPKPARARADITELAGLCCCALSSERNPVAAVLDRRANALRNQEGRNIEQMHRSCARRAHRIRRADTRTTLSAWFRGHPAGLAKSLVAFDVPLRDAAMRRESLLRTHIAKEGATHRTVATCRPRRTLSTASLATRHQLARKPEYKLKRRQGRRRRRG